MNPSNRIDVHFPGGKRVHARFGAYELVTDQPPEFGGEGAAAAPFDLYLASLATCAGVYALGFCQNRGISTEGMRVLQEVEEDPETHLPTRVRLRLQLPAGFPDKYRAAIQRSVDGCKVKKSLANPPTFSVELETGV
jgi:putative redox protein